MLNEAIRYQDGQLCADGTPLTAIADAVGTPAYVYSLPRVRANLARLQDAFAPLHAHVHYSAKANANLSILKAIVRAGAGIDAVSFGEIFRALAADAPAEDVVFAGVGKTEEEMRQALTFGVGWFNVENEGELALLNRIATEEGLRARVALRYNPDVAANTHPYIATGHGGAKFGLSADTVADLLARRADFPNLDVDGIHVHIGSQLGDVHGTVEAVRLALALIAPHPHMRSVNIGGGFPNAYADGDPLPTFHDFAAALAPLLTGYDVLIEPGRSIVADAGVLLVRVLYIKQHGGETFVITDGSMAELIRPALYGARHAIVPVQPRNGASTPVHVVGPVCETADALGHDVPLPPLEPGDLLAVLDAGAYGFAMASNYNQRPRVPEVVTEADGWRVARRRETYADLLACEAEVEA